MAAFFVTGTGTDIGKTYITAALAEAARHAGYAVAAYKPVMTGWDDRTLPTSDTGVLIKALGWSADPATVDRISPWRYKAPLAPSMAARLEGATLPIDQLVAWSQKRASGPEELILIEGVGGVMVPLDDRSTVIDWIAALGIKTLLVTGTYLGTISHTLTALETLAKRKIEIGAIIVNETENSGISLHATMDEIARFTDSPLLPVARGNGPVAWPSRNQIETLLG